MILCIVILKWLCWAKARNRSGQPDQVSGLTWNLIWPDLILTWTELTWNLTTMHQVNLTLTWNLKALNRSGQPGQVSGWPENLHQLFRSTWNLTWPELNWLRLSGFRLISGWPEMDQVRSGFFYKITWPDLNFQVGLFLTWFRPRSTCSEP